MKDAEGQLQNQIPVWPENRWSKVSSVVEALPHLSVLWVGDWDLVWVGILFSVPKALCFCLHSPEVPLQVVLVLQETGLQPTALFIKATERTLDATAVIFSS